ncbi:hypothetical protein CPB84DRAFT_1959343 [Gymnopilus junonius]|uniref:Transmembrane protein n=1 Tax=Gymnopilus junonius TaxID=109634 RepID=A0A9P5TRX9_GYMJU|nr:hypothetical protein CPB84DRAFT_1959343 [Gymnopilus junonius]
MAASLLDALEVFGRAEVVTISKPLIPFLEAPWSSKSKYPAILLEIFFYGVYVVLFGCAAFTLIRQKSVQRPVLAAFSLLFLLGTADVILTTYFFFKFVLQVPGVTRKDEKWNKFLEVKFAVYLVANAISSSFLIIRSYEIWHNMRIIVAPVLLVLCSTVIGFVSISARHMGDKLLASSFITSAAANLSVTLLTATGILWTSRKMRGNFKITFPDIFDYVSNLLIDSGALYGLSIFLYLVFHALVVEVSLTQIAGITITAMILRKTSSEPLVATIAFSSTTTLPEIHDGVTPMAQSLSHSRIRTFFANRRQRGDTVTEHK